MESNNKIKFFPGILVLTILSIISSVTAGTLFETALRAMKEASGVVGAFIILIIFILVLIINVILTIIDIPLTINSLRTSENKTFPLIMLIVEAIILIIAIILVILLFTNR